MNNDSIKGTARKAEGTVESAYGSVTGKKDTELKGEANKLAGKAQELMGDAEDKVVTMATKVRGFIDSASENLTAAKETVNTEIHDSPVRSSFIALGIGFILGALLAR